MNVRTVLGCAPLRALLLVPLALALHASPALAQATPGKGAAAATTLDICEDAATGQWRYSGVVSLLDRSAGDNTGVKIDYIVQNKTTGPDFVDVYKAQRGDTASAGISGTLAQVIPFSVQAAPLVLGSVRNVARIEIFDTTGASSARTLLQPSFAVTAAMCGCHEVKGCVRTQGYWGSKPNVIWPAPYSRSAYFFGSGLTNQTILDSPVKGSGYLILAKQYLAAVLNYAAGASAPPSVIQAINEASTFFSSGTTPASCGPSDCAAQKTLAGILDTYNNGLYPGAPKSCPD